MLNLEEVRAGAAEDDRLAAAEDNDGLYGAAVKGESGANGKHRWRCPGGKGCSGPCHRRNITGRVTSDDKLKVSDLALLRENPFQMMLIR
ncbi:hypothetical protein FQA39_LY14686 [Lamprigera yunnana]|nr:hypothetical protein FQA39_LY14686 [Lamprigera yunnana]